MHRPSRARIRFPIAFRIPVVAATTLAFAVAILPAACSSGPGMQLCGQSPGNGCPVGRGGTCDDASCEGLYDCVDGAWRLVESCPGGTGGAGGAPDAGEM